MAGTNPGVDVLVVAAARGRVPKLERLSLCVLG